MVKILGCFIILFYLISCDNHQSTQPSVKKSVTGICHKVGTQYYKQTKKFKVFNSIKDCLKSGGRLPK